jgi:hypothetical protein
VWCEGFNW